VLVSDDRRAWTRVASGVASDLWGVKWVGGGAGFVAVGDGGVILTSATGDAWTPRSSGTTAALRGLAASGARVVATGGTGTIVTSTDGSTWQPATSPTARHLRAAAWTGTVFAAAGGPGELVRSSDGAAWTAVAAPTAGTELVDGLAAFGGGLIGVGTTGLLVTSPDGATWGRGSLGVQTSFRGIAASAGTLVAVGSGTDAAATTILESTDGVAWRASTRDHAWQLEAVLWDGARFVAVGEQGAVLVAAP
jgi:hypothetical protein